MIEKIKNIAQKYFDEIVSYRRHLHQYPEISKQEKETANFICQKLDEIGVSYKRNVGGYGIYGFVEGENPTSKCVAIRADMDALPIKETNNIPYCSKNEGVMHACGHDVHMATLLGTIKILKDLKNDFEGRVMFIFQASEEDYPGGAITMLNEGLFDEVKPSAIFGFHTTPEMETGYIGMKEGKYMASTDEIYIDVIGRGGHGGTPDLNIDPVVIGANIVVGLQSIVSRKADPTMPTVLSFGKFIADGRTNVIPNIAHMEGTLRTFDENWRKECHQLIEQIVVSTAKAHDADAKVFIDPGYPFIYNNPELTKKTFSWAKEYFGDDKVLNLDMRMTAEDFSYFAQRTVGCYFRIGTKIKDKPITNLHTSNFDVDEKCIELGMGSATFFAISALNSNEVK